ncbi:hypothetical protein ASG32_27285 [Methylobacterium sp. Leaf361]|nr:hypothetical protein ASG32_27285 [Methylobacterium sp. Leaf361]
MFTVFDAMKAEADIPESVSSEATRLASLLAFLGAQADEFVKSCPDVSDPRFPIALFAQGMILDIINKRRHPIEAFFRGVGDVEGRVRLPQQDRVVRSVLVGCVYAVRDLSSRDRPTPISLSSAIGTVLSNPALASACQSEKSLRHLCDEPSDDLQQASTRTRDMLLAHSPTAEAAVEAAAKIISNMHWVPSPYDALKANTHRLYYRLEEDGAVTFDLPKGSRIEKHLTAQVLAALPAQAHADGSDEDGSER